MPVVRRPRSWVSASEPRGKGAGCWLGRMRVGVHVTCGEVLF
jgi:hypothetical protein